MKKGRLACSTVRFPQNTVFSNKWVPITWEYYTDPDLLPGASDIWSYQGETYISKMRYGLNGNNYYYHGIKIGRKFDSFVWNNSVVGGDIWTDGKNVYYSKGTATQQVLNGMKWEEKVWSGFVPSVGYEIWSDGSNIYYSDTTNSDSFQYVLKNGVFEPHVWDGDNRVEGQGIWSDGENVYYNSGKSVQLIGNTFVEKNWGVKVTGYHIWTDGNKVYYSSGYPGSNQYVLEDGVWKPQTWLGLPSGYYFTGNNVWSDGTDIYLGSEYMLERAKPQTSAMTLGYQMGQAVRRMRGTL